MRGFHTHPSPSRPRGGYFVAAARFVLVIAWLSVTALGTAQEPEAAGDPSGRPGSAAASSTPASVSLSLDDVAALSVAADREVAVLARELEEQLDDLGLSGYLDGMELTLGGSVSGDASTEPFAQASAELTAAVEIIPQLTVTGKLSANESAGEPPARSTPVEETDPLSANLGISFSPLADSTGRDREELQAEKSALSLQDAERAAAFSGLTACLDLLSAGAALDIMELQLDVAERALLVTEALHERDRATDQDLDTAEDAFSDLDRQVVHGELAVERAREVLARLLALDTLTLYISGIDTGELEALAAAARNVLSAATTEDLAADDSAVATALLEVQLADLAVEAARRFNPRIGVNATGGLPDSQYEVGVTVSISPSDWDRSAVSEAEADLAYAETEYDYMLRLAELDADSALKELEFAIDDLDRSLDDLTDAEQDLTEAEFRYERGDITLLARDQAKLAVAEAEHAMFISQLEVARSLWAIEFRQY